MMLSVFRMYEAVMEFFNSLYSVLDSGQVLAYQNARLRLLVTHNELEEQAKRRRRGRRLL